MRIINTCKTCGELFALFRKISYCSTDCWNRRAPAVYRFSCPDGRSYVGAVGDIRKRNARGVDRSNSRLAAAFAQYPPESWIFEILEVLPPGCTVQELRAAEQRHMERLHSLDPQHGFNIWPAIWASGKYRQQMESRRWGGTWTATRSALRRHFEGAVS